MANVSSINGIEKYPKLRFPEFTEPWKMQCAEELFENIVDKNHPDDTVLTIIQGSGTLPRSESSRNIRYDEKGVANYKRVNAYDYIIHLRSFEGGLEMANSQGIISPAYTVLRSKKEFAPLFYDAYFHTDEFINHILAKSVEGIRDGRQISYEAFKWLPIPTCNIEEQKKIADLFRVLNDRIKAHQLLVDSFKKYKRGVVKTLLDPNNNQRQGVVWKKDTIGNLGTFIKGAALSKADISDSGTPFILYGELYTTYKEVVRTVVRTTQANVDDVYLSKVGDVVIPTSGETPVEISTASCIMVPDVILAGDLNIYRGTIVDGRIMSYLLNHIVNDQIARVAQGKSVVHVQASEIGKILITYPDHNEQERIAQILELIDNRIEVSAKTLNSMQMMKKALLQQLFI